MTDLAPTIAVLMRAVRWNRTERDMAESESPGAGYHYASDAVLLEAVAKALEKEPAAWMRDDGLEKPVWVVATRVKELWLEANKECGKHYTIPLYVIPRSAP